MRNAVHAAPRAALVLVLLAVRSADAQPALTCPEGTPPAEQAAAWLQRARLESSAGNSSAALDAYQLAHACKPSAAAALGMAEALLAAGRMAEAHAAYASVAALKPSTKERKQAEEALAALELTTAVLEVVVEPSDADIELDGRMLPAVRGPLRLPIGPHKLRVRKEGYQEAGRELSLQPRASSTVQITLEPEVSTGTLQLRESSAQQARLIIEGLDAGPVPWTGALAPGRYRMWLLSSSGRSEVRWVAAEAGKTTQVSLQVQGAGEPLACNEDASCEGGKSCVEGRCRGEDDPDPARNYGPSVGLGWRVGFGLLDTSAYPAPVHFVMPELELPLSRVIRWHLSGGYMNQGAHAGFRISPFGLGLPFRLATPGAMELWVEPMLDVASLSATSMVGDIDAFGSFGFSARVTLRHGRFLFSATPANLEMVIVRWVGTKGVSQMMQQGGSNFACGLGAGVML